MAYIPSTHIVGCSELENPIGIETFQIVVQYPSRTGCSELENPIGIETKSINSDYFTQSKCCSELENPIGIETMICKKLTDMILLLQRT